MEAIVKKAIQKLTYNPTTITIVHRLTTIVKSDIIMVPQKGKIIESGSHIDLMHTKTYYRILVEHLTSGLAVK